LKHAADQTHPSLFDPIKLVRDHNSEPDYAGYLGFARTLASELTVRPQPTPPAVIPSELEAELVYFRV
jgi:hypothetical protein